MLYSTALLGELMLLLYVMSIFDDSCSNCVLCMMCTTLSHVSVFILLLVVVFVGSETVQQ